MSWHRSGGRAGGQLGFALTQHVKPVIEMGLGTRPPSLGLQELETYALAAGAVSQGAHCGMVCVWLQASS